MKIPQLGIELMSSKETETLRKTSAKSARKVKQLEKSFRETQNTLAMLQKQQTSNLAKRARKKTGDKETDYPSLDIFRSGNFYHGGVIHPIQYWNWRDLELYSKQSDLIRLCKSVIKKEVFRRGRDWQPAFEGRCINCKQEFQDAVEDCTVCHGDVVPPNPANRDFVDEILKKPNAQGKDFTKVNKQIEDDLNTLDNGWIIAIKEYLTNELDELVGSIAKEFVRGDPNTMRIVADEKGLLGQKWWMCPIHREQLKDKPGMCEVGGIELRPVHYVSVYFGTNDPETYYLEDEVLHLQKYSDEVFYGVPPVFTVILKTLSEIGMDKFVYDAYQKQRMPKGLMMINTDNPDSLDKEWRRMLDRVTENPHYTPALAISSQKGQGQSTFIKFIDTLTEMQYVDARVQLRRMVGAFFGVEPLFLGDVSSSGGLNNEGLQITVTNRALESAHQIYNEQIFPWVLKQFNLEDWVLLMNPSEERDEMAELQRDHQKTATAQLMQTMGFDVTRDEHGEFVFSDEPVREPIKQTLFGNTNFDDANTLGGMPFTKKKDELMKFAGEQKASTLKNLLIKELDDLQKRTNFKSFNQEQIRKTISDLVKKISKNMLDLTSKQLETAYKSGLNEISNKTGIVIKFGGRDEAALKTIKNQRVLSTAYNGFTKEMTKRTNAAIEEAFDEGDITTKNIVSKLDDTIEASEGALKRIARTETHKVLNIAKANAWMEAQEGRKLFMFKWGGPRDTRVTEYCSAIKKKVKKEGGGRGVSLKRLREIIEEESDQSIFQKVTPFTPHINCRHELQRIV